jgi:glutaredoxin 3
MRGKAVMRKHLGEDGVTVLELDGREDMGQLQDELQRITGARTVPRIFIDGVFVGGASDVAELDASGELAKMLQAKGLTS